MSSIDRATRATEVALTDEFRSAMDDARDRVAAVLVPACPTETFLTALREEVERAQREPESVPYPELADADAYWEATVRPQARSVRNAVAEIVEWLEERVISTMEAAEVDLKSMVTIATASSEDPAEVRTKLEADIEERCQELHHQMAEVLDVLPTTDAVIKARQSVVDAIRAQASTDVESLKSAYLRDAGGDDAHQQFAEQQWSETFAARVAHREALLAGVAPWRHQELALVGYERTLSEIEELVEAAVIHLQSPLRDVQALLMQRYDEAVAAAQV